MKNTFVPRDFALVLEIFRIDSQRFVWHKKSRRIMNLLPSILVISIFLITPSLSLTMSPLVDIVTGATQGIGKAVAEYIAEERSKTINTNNDGNNIKSTNGYLLVLVGRNEQRGSQTKDFIQKKYNGLSVAFESVDLSDWEDVQNLEKRIAAQLGEDDYHVGILVNDAAECPQEQQWTQLKQRKGDKGDCSLVSVDKQFGTNVLGYHFMIKAFRDHYSLEEVQKHPTHIVNVASTWAGSLDLSDVNFEKRPYDNDDAYRQSKQCDRMLSCLWAQKLDGKAIVNACHPGDPCTTLSKALGYNLFASAPTAKFISQDSPFPYLCGLDPNHEVTAQGEWFVGSGRRPSRCAFAARTAETQKLFDLCESFCF